MKKSNYLFVIAAVFMISCGGSDQSSSESTEAPKSMVAEEKPVDPMENKGIGPISSLVRCCPCHTVSIIAGRRDRRPLEPPYCQNQKWPPRAPGLEAYQS